MKLLLRLGLIKSAAAVVRYIIVAVQILSVDECVADGELEQWEHGTGGTLLTWHPPPEGHLERGAATSSISMVLVPTQRLVSVRAGQASLVAGDVLAWSAPSIHPYFHGKKKGWWVAVDPQLHYCPAWRLSCPMLADSATKHPSLACLACLLHYPSITLLS